MYRLLPSRPASPLGSAEISSGDIGQNNNTHPSQPPSHPTSGGRPNDSSRRNRFFGGTPPDIYTILADIEGASANLHSITPKIFFKHIERILESASLTETKIQNLAKKVEGLLKRIVFTHEEPDNIKELHDFFFYALPPQHKRRGSIFSISRWGRNTASSSGYAQLSSEDDSITAYRITVSMCIVERYKEEINTITQNENFQEVKFGVDSWQYPFLKQMKKLLEERSLHRDALSTLANHMQRIHPELLKKDFSKANDYADGDPSPPSVRFLRDIDNSLKKYRTNQT